VSYTHGKTVRLGYHLNSVQYPSGGRSMASSCLRQDVDATKRDKIKARDVRILESTEAGFPKG